MCAVRVVKAVSIFGCFYFKTKMFFFSVRPDFVLTYANKNVSKLT